MVLFTRLCRDARSTKHKILSYSSKNARTDTSELGLSPFLVSVSNGLSGIKKCIGKISLHLQLETNTPEILNVPSYNNQNNWGQANLGAVLWKLGHIFIWTTFLILRSEDRIPVGARFLPPVLTGHWAHPSSCTTGTGSFPGVKSGMGVTLILHPVIVQWSWMKRYSYTSTPPMGRTACTEPQCLYKGALYFSCHILLRRTHFWNVSRHFEYNLYPASLYLQRLQTSAGKSICPLSLFLLCWCQTCCEE